VPSPKDILRDLVVAEIAPALASLGFSFSPGAIRFSRKAADARQVVDFSLNQRNQTDSIHFWTIWRAHAPGYVKWMERQWGGPRPNDELGGCSDGNLPGFRPRGGDQFDLSDPGARIAEMGLLRTSMLAIGVPFVDSISTYRGAADRICDDHETGRFTSSFLYPRAVDFYLIAEDRERAEKALRRALERLSRLDSPAREQHADVIAQLQARQSKYFGK
jgi:hypothetical protein